MKRFFPKLIKVAGLIIALGTGLCSLWAFVTMFKFGTAFVLPPCGNYECMGTMFFLVLGVLPCILGIAMFYLGRYLQRKWSVTQ